MSEKKMDGSTTAEDGTTAVTGTDETTAATTGDVDHADPWDADKRAEIEEIVTEAIKEVYDPEIPVNVYDLGLIYGVQVNPDHTVNITMTLTTPNCPAAGFLPGQVEARARHVPGVKDAKVEITFDPPFTPEMMSDEAKLELGFL